MYLITSLIQVLYFQGNYPLCLIENNGNDQGQELSVKYIKRNTFALQ